MSVLDRMHDVELHEHMVVQKIESEELGTGILLRSNGGTFRFWGPPSMLHRFIRKLDGALEEIVNPAPVQSHHHRGVELMEVGPS